MIHKKIQILFLISLSLYSCKKEEYLSIVTGQVLNKATQLPISGAIVQLSDGTAVEDWLLSSSGATVVDIDTTDEYGRFHLQIKSESQNVEFIAYKSGYEYQAGSSMGHTSLQTGGHNITAILQGLAYFNSTFEQISSIQNDTDTLKINLLSYENLTSNYQNWSAFEFHGTGKFTISDNPFLIAKVLGDRYLRYKLEFTNNGVWQTKIDSVFLPTSPDVYTQTIYY